MLNAVPLTRDLVFVGGGHAHALVLRKWGMNSLPGARLTVINPGPTAPYTGMLPGHVAGHYSRDTLEIDLMRLARFAGARLILAHATAIDRDAKLIHVEGRPPVAYDVASIDIGITARMDIPGFDAHAVGAKPLDIYARAWRDFLDRAQPHQTPTIAVIGGGVAGCELAMAMAFALRERGAAPQVTVIEAGADISGVGARARARLHAAMRDLGVRFEANAKVTRIAQGEVILADHPAVKADLCVGAAGAFPHGWIARTDLPQHDGFIVIDPDLRVSGDAHLFAVGDCAHMPFAPRPKAGVFAVRAAPVLHHNLRAVLTSTKLKPFRPQKSYLKLISLGGKSALAEKWGFAPAGPLLWRWKDRIDRTFMDKLDTLPVMRPPALPDVVVEGVRDGNQTVPLCGGCGAKVGGGVLKSGLVHPEGTLNPDIVSGPGDDAAILRFPGGGFQVLSTDHLRAFIEDPVQMARIAAVHALGDIWAMGATPQAALSSIVLPRMSPALQERTLREINDTARSVFQQAGASVVGGHTTMGAELTIGFTVTGTRAEMPITVSGARAGDVLVLTRPIGSGVVLAAHMAGTAPARVVADTLSIMQQPQDVAARVLENAHAMTDTTGFGLAGHIQAMCTASTLQAEIWRDRVPFYPGARALSDRGVASSLLAANVADAPTTGIADPLLHDPQTAGGLLAALPPDAAETAIEALRAQGCTGWIIGQLDAGTGPIRVS
ncbi:selenide, water dikinase SelD [uncultured Sulfitobacter sp.]|uniref:selenide, water dikinase SelD n=1 Tax=uncultured Sulfitobacter sp. TaxID=191468 RepID=UPI0026290FAE|nr:selenide, water dikinase SelD [uncultured Sulfitobacter sp.]